MPEQLRESEVSRYISEQAEEMLTLVGTCSTNDRVQFLSYLLVMVRDQARSYFDDGAKLRLVAPHEDVVAGK